MFALTADGRFQNTPLTKVLRTDHPQSQREVALFLLYLDEQALERTISSVAFDLLADRSS
jgi:hypothetical protein